MLKTSSVVNGYIFIIYLLFSGCYSKLQPPKVTLIEDIDDKPEGQFAPSRWQYNSHRVTTFNAANGGAFEYDCPYLRTMKGLYQSKSLNLPLIYKACREPIDRFKAPVVIWLHGGPFTYASAENITAKHMFLKNGFTIVEPLYRGSHERPWNFLKPLGKLSSFIDTRNEIIELANFYRKKNRKIIYAGDSFGGFVISSLILTTGSDESVVLFQPALSSRPIIEQWENQTPKLDKKSEITFRIFCNKTQYKDCNDIKKWSNRNILSSYYGFSPTIDYKNKKISPSVYIISGKEDKVVGISEARLFAAKFPSSVHHLIVPDLGHEDIRNISQFNQIEKFLAPVLALGNVKDNDK